ncbi:Rha family transcriptional regulator [Nguyenibacter vanlangensis]|uniref:Rha family transcriptional regulator n=1 Tax=Nguyenibacter vanlangensis TaxID=1216886 RepID=A0A7Y7ISX4_9PROT|nr:Rha family transcriptional regulator [Nguyenibacter vanlangensis]NVN09741.1 Rha family transcriptional regulator [Nguyenibacter vanlangensis]
MNAILPTDAPRTMSSREIAELTGKAHKNVIRDIETMIADIEKDGSDLSHQAKSNGYRIDRDIRGYVSAIHLTQDLTYNLILGYDAVRRLKVVRRWMELESGAASAPKPKAPRAPALIGPRRQTLGLIELYTRVNEMRGLDRNAALISANDRATVKTGINLFEEAGPVRMDAPDQEPVMNVTAIAAAIGGISNRRINPALIEMGYQIKGGKGCRCPYQATDLGKPHSRVVDSPRKHASGFSQELLWKPSIIPLIKTHLAGATSPYAAVALAADADLVPRGGLL